MDVINFTEARNNLKSIFDRVCRDEEEIVVHRKNGENVVILSLDHFNALRETAHLLASPANRERLLRSLTHAREGNLRAFDPEA